MTTSRSTRWLLALLAAVSLAVSPVVVEARSSGGYSRPSSRSYSTPTRTPSIGSGGYRRPAPSSGGYSGPSRTPSIVLPNAGSDRAVSRQGSGSALETYRRQQTNSPRPTPMPGSPRDYMAPWPQPRDWTPGIPRTSRTGGLRQRYDYDDGPRYRNPGWPVPPYARTDQAYGSWNPFLLWFLLDTLARPGHSDFFHNHQGDPGYRQWRTDADRQAQDNPELKAKLDELDRTLAEKAGQPKNEAYLPPDVQPEQAKVNQPSQASGGLGFGSALLWIVVFSLIFGFGVMFVTRLLSRSGRLAPKGSPMSRLNIAKAVLQSKTGLGDAPTAQVGPRFRVGQVLTLDPTPFLLAPNTRVAPPSGLGADAAISVTAVGEINQPIRLTRLHLNDGQFIQIHVSENGDVDDCRYFSRFDEVIPQDADEWDFWLSPKEGMIGYPIFETKDGIRHTRLWKPGPEQTSPVVMTEIRTTNMGSRRIELTAMLYKRDDAAPAEYLLVEVEQDEDRSASVVLYTGLDIPPASLGL